MKSILLTLSLLALIQSNLLTLTNNCQEQHVPDLNKICIRPNYIQGCQTYKNLYQCAVCAKDYELEKGKCSTATGSDVGSNALIGCLIDNGKQCSNCANGFIRVDGLCQKAVKYCKEYDTQKQCIKCQDQYSLIFGDCRHNLMLGCKLEQTDHVCLECFKPFELKNYQCVIPNCKSYNDYGCYSCQCGYYISQTRSCQPMQDGCLKYYRGTCVECFGSYKLKGGVCSIQGCLKQKQGVCTLCKENYQKVDKTCKFKNCLEWKDDSCLICDKNYSLVGGKCVEKSVKYVCSG